MKVKVLYVALASLFAVGAAAQDCAFFFPQTEGAQLVRKGYDAQGNLKNVLKYKVDHVENIPSGTEVEADFVVLDAGGRVIGEGDFECTCQDGEFFMEMSDVASYPQAMSLIGEDIVLTSDFLNYPDAFSGAPSLDGSGGYYFDDANIKIYSKNNKKKRANVSIHNREYVTTEEVTTPAGTFNCAKVRYDVDVNSPKGKVSGYGFEWYAPNVGVVRSEQYDSNDALQSYTVLEEVN